MRTEINDDTIASVAEQLMKTVTLYRHRYAVQYGMKLANVDVRVMADYAGGSLFCKLFHDVYSAKASKTMSITVPDTWLDAFKLRWYPKWLLSRYPAKMRTVAETVEARALFPELESANGEHYMVFTIYDKKDEFL